MNPAIILPFLFKLAPHIAGMVSDAQNVIQTVESSDPRHVKAQQLLKDAEDFFGTIVGLL